MPEIKKINHVALVVEDIETTLQFWRDALGLKVEKITEVPKEESVVAFLPIGNCEIELVQPTSTASGVAKYLKKRGSGMHHLCLEVKEINKVMEGLVERGVQMIHEIPVQAEDGRRYAFIHPKSTYGVLIELYEIPTDQLDIFPILVTERLILREFSEKDVPAIFEMYSRQDMNQYLEHEPMKSIEEAEVRVQKRINLFKNGWGGRWAIAFKDQSEKVIGSCGYFHVRIGTHTVEIGFEVHPEYWHQGIMTEAMTAILDYSFSKEAFQTVNRVEALVDPGNQASLALLQNLGFVIEGTRRKFGFWGGVYHDVKFLALLREDWRL